MMKIRGVFLCRCEVEEKKEGDVGHSGIGGDR